VESRISVAGTDPAGELESLSDWLRAEPELVGRVRLVGPEPDPIHLGALADVLTVAVGAGGALTVLASSLRAWLSQPRRSDIRVLIHGAGDRVVEISGERVDSSGVEALLREALRGGDQG